MYAVLDVIEQYPDGISFDDIKYHFALNQTNLNFHDGMIAEGLKLLQRYGKITHDWKLEHSENEQCIATKKYKVNII